MKNLVVAALAVLVLGNVARAALVLHVPDIVLTESSQVQTGSFDVYVEETLGTEESLLSYNVGLRQVPGGIATFTGIGPSSSEHPMVLNPTFLLDQTRNRAGSGYVEGQDLYVTNEAGAPVAISNGTRDGLFSVSYSIPANTPAGTVIAINIDPDATRLFNMDNRITYVADHGSFTIVPVPEPASIGLALLALPLLARRRR
ncbi:MAG TPA: hypothetical protein VGR35_21690 [Tepidisphaeraceae bacterium]|nr:hypothetical protein [Tepidisphaeraceae bacterium]